MTSSTSSTMCPRTRPCPLAASLRRGPTLRTRTTASTATSFSVRLRTRPRAVPPPRRCACERSARTVLPGRPHLALLVPPRRSRRFWRRGAERSFRSPACWHAQPSLIVPQRAHSPRGVVRGRGGDHSLTGGGRRGAGFGRRRGAGFGRRQVLGASSPCFSSQSGSYFETMQGIRLFSFFVRGFKNTKEHERDKKCTAPFSSPPR